MYGPKQWKRIQQRKRQAQVSRNLTWSECYLGGQEVGSPPKGGGKNVHYSRGVYKNNATGAEN